MAFRDYVTSYPDNLTTAGTTKTLTVSGATVGNLLVASVVLYQSSQSPAFVTPTGWSLIKSFSDTEDKFHGAWYYRIATGDSDDDFDPSWTGNNYAALLATEWEGPWPAVALASSGHDILEISDLNAASVGTGTATPILDGGLAISMLATRWYSGWTINTTDSTNKITQPAGFTRRAIYAWQNTRPLIEHASKTYSTATAQSGTWSTSEAGQACYGSVAVFKPSSASSWTLTNMTSALDAPGLEAAANTATTLTATANNGYIIGTTETITSQNCAGRYFIKRKTGTGTIEISIDGGTTWVDVTTLVDAGTTVRNGFVEVATDLVTTDPQLGIRLGTNGDEVIVAGAERFHNRTDTEILGADPVPTTETPSTVYTPLGAAQSGEWSGVSWQTVPDKSRNYDMDDGASTLDESLDAQDGTIVNHNPANWT